MPLVQVLLVLIVVGVLLWLVNLIPMQVTIKSILNSVVVIFVVIWLPEYIWFNALSHPRARGQLPLVTRLNRSDKGGPPGRSARPCIAF